MMEEFLLAGSSKDHSLMSISRCALLFYIGEIFKTTRDPRAEDVIANALRHEKHTVRHAALRILLERMETLNPLNREKVEIFLNEKKNEYLVSAVKKETEKIREISAA